MPDLAGMSLFVTIVEEGSLSAAGRALGLPKATVSRRLALFEAGLGTPLLARSTRALNLTDAGRRLFERARPLVREAEAAEAEIAAAQAEPAGLVRVAVSVAYGQAVVAPRLLAFAERHPGMRLDLRLSDERVNLIADGFDLAVRMGGIEDSELVARKLAEVAVLVVAAPSYLDVRGRPDAPEDLRRHVAVLTRPDLDHWHLGEQVVRVPWRVSTGSMAVTRDAVLAGLGLALVPEFMVERDLAEGRLVRLLPDHEAPAARATALYPRSVVPSRGLRAVMAALMDAKVAI